MGRLVTPRRQGSRGLTPFTYTICDDDTPTATCDTATVTVTVTDEGSPDAVDDAVTVTEDTTTATAIDAIGNDDLTDDATYLAGQSGYDRDVWDCD